MAAFCLDTHCVPFQCVYRNGRMPHHVGSTSDGVCREECLVRVLAVRFPKRLYKCHLSTVVSIRHRACWKFPAAQISKSCRFVIVANRACVDMTRLWGHEHNPEIVTWRYKGHPVYSVKKIGKEFVSIISATRYIHTITRAYKPSCCKQFINE
jgi:hypothetical protein